MASLVTEYDWYFIPVLNVDGYLYTQEVGDDLPDTQNCRLRMRRECRERFLRHRLQRKPLVSDPGMHHGTCVKHAPWCMSGSLASGGGENFPGAGATHNFAYLVKGPLLGQWLFMITSSNESDFGVTVRLWRESIGNRWFPSQRTSNIFFDVSLNKL